MNNISMPTKEGGWVTPDSPVADNTTSVPVIEINREDIRALIEENNNFVESVSKIYDSHKIKTLNDVVTYLKSIETSLNQLL